MMFMSDLPRESVGVGSCDDDPSCPMSKKFRFVLPPDRLGTSHDSLGSFRKAVSVSAATVATRRKEEAAAADSSGTSTACSKDGSDPPSPSLRQSKEYTLIVVTTHDVCRVLLGLKHRGFGTGLFNSFGGKVEPGENIAGSAQRELREETGILLSLDFMKRSHLGTLFFTFEDSATEMVVHLFHVRIRTADPEVAGHSNGDPDGKGSAGSVASLGPDTIDDDESDAPFVCPGAIRGCDEITPQWFETRDIPLHNMFADDSVWLTRLLSQQQQQQQSQRGSRFVSSLDGWFHFAAGGAETNTVLHYHLDLRVSTIVDASVKTSLEQVVELGG